jgi:alanyl-tRNA synthetase
MSERLYHSDSFLRTFTAAVTDLREFTSGNGKLAWQLALDRTAFYPTSGGQPFDTGRLSALARDGAALMVPVEQIEEDEEGTV